MCAARVSAAAGRRRAGTSGHAASKQLVFGAESRVQRLEEPAFAVEAVGDVLVELCRRVPDHRAVARAQRLEIERAQAAQRVEVRGQRALARGDEDAPLPEHRVAR